MAAPSPAEAAAPTAGGMKQHLPFIIALVAGLAVGGGAGAFVVGPAKAKGITPGGPAAPRAHAAPDAEAAADEESADEGAGGEHGDAAKGGEKPVYTIDNLVLNPAESGGTRFLLLSVTFELKSAAVLEEMKSRDAELRDAVLVTLGGKTVDQLADMGQREALKGDLTRAATTLFKKGAVRRIYFPQFVIQ